MYLSYSHFLISRCLQAQSESAQAALQSNGGTRSSAAVQGILKAARKNGELSKFGVLGRLGDLASIDDEYDVAISTACSHLDFIVVQTAVGAQKCLDFVRQHKLGRVSFIPLDKMKKGAHDRVTETPEGAPRLYDLINPAKPFLAPAIFLAVGDTLVAPDLETATRWAYDYGKRWRVVTLDGKLIETSGTMSGGGKRVNRGGMKLSSGRSNMALADEEDEAADATSLQEAVLEAQRLLQECRKMRKELGDEIRLLKKNVKSLEMKLPKLTVELGGFETTRKELTKLVPELRLQSKLSDEDEEKLDELKRKVLVCKTDMASCSMKASKLEAEIARLQKSIMEAGGSKLKKQQALCEKALAALDSAEKALNTANVSISSMTKAASQAEKAKIAAELDLKNCLLKIESLLSEFKLLEVDAFKVMEEYEKAKITEAEAKSSLEEASKEYEELKKSQTENKCVEVELIGKVEDLVKIICELDRKRLKWESDLVKLRTAAADDDSLDDSDDESDDGINECNDAVAPSGTDDMELEGESPTVAPSKAQPRSKSAKSTLPSHSYDELAKYEKDDILKEIDVLEAERNTIAKNANMGAIAEYRKKEADYLAR